MKFGSGIAIAGATLGWLAAESAGAHPIEFHAGGFVAGASHPLFGLDHVLAMVALGVWAAQCGGHARWALPLAAIGAMGAGGALAMGGIALPHVEAGVAASVLGLGLLVALAMRLPALFGATITAVFALWHGYTHGASLPALVSPAGYAAGFVLASASLTVFGLGAGALILAQHPRRARIAGACVVAAGVVLLASA